MHVVVLGAGVIGVTTAYYLSERGHSVTVVDRAAEVASGASGGNGGQLSYSFTDAMASHALLSKLPGLMAGLNPAFLSQCTAGRNRNNTTAILKLALRSGRYWKPRKNLHHLLQTFQSARLVNGVGSGQ